MTTTPTPPATRKNHDLPALKERLLIPEAWQALGLEGRPAARCRSPFRPDKHPSFSIYEGGRRWKDFATGQGGDVIDFIAMARQVSTAQALRLFLELAGVPAATTAPVRSQPAPAALRPPQPSAPGTLRVPIHRGSEEEWRQIARTRAISLEAVHLALGLRTLTFGLVQGFRCWILADDEHRLAEARRVDGHPFPECGPLAARKAHTLRGSTKSWPLGAAVLRRIPDFRVILLVEGGPDYLAALHLADEHERWDVLPVAMLGRGTGTHLHPDALALLAGRRVRLCPHADADGGGMQRARLWATQLQLAGCTVDLFDFTPLRRTDGRPVKDLNDCTACLDEASAADLRATLIPPPPPPLPPPGQSHASSCLSIP